MPKTIKNMNNCLHKALSQAQKEGLILNNPCDGTHIPRGEYKEIEVFTLEEHKKLIQESYCHRYGVFIRLVFVTGLRIGELMGLQWQDIDFTNSCISVKRTLNRLNTYSGKRKTEIVLGTPKSKNSARVIPISAAAMEDLKKWKGLQQNDRELASVAYKDSGFVVTNELGSYMEPKTFRDYYHRMLGKAGLRKFTFHALRHTFATRAMERGMDSKTLSVIMGHYSVAFTLDTYTHVLSSHKKEEIKVMDDLYSLGMYKTAEKLLYPIIVEKNEEGYHLTSPDFEEIVMNAHDLETGMEKIKTILYEKCKDCFIPEPSKIEDLKVSNRGWVMFVASFQEDS